MLIEIMGAFDVLLLPSKFEGMPNVAIEAQAARLPSVISDAITKEVRIINRYVTYLSLKDTADI
ncbi:MAG: glycosyltransferase [Candidatus Thiodiazotropha sp.]|jgi:glycosyltransferase involved in cell wall biosynthesis